MRITLPRISFYAILRCAIFVILAVYATLFIMQRHMLFVTHIANTHWPYKAPTDYALNDYDTVELYTKDGVKITAWNHSPAANMPIIVYFHGNGSNIATRHARYAHFTMRGYGVFAPEYRGYGYSEDQPSEEGIYNDARASIEWLHLHYPSSRIILMGESLGTGVAVEMAKEYTVSGVVLLSAYTSIPDRVSEIYWFLPGIQYLVRDRFDSIAKIASLHTPVLIMHADNDGTIPIAHGKRLSQAANAEEVQFISIKGSGHNIPDSDLLPAMDTFFHLPAPAVNAQQN